MPVDRVLPPEVRARLLAVRDQVVADDRALVSVLAERAFTPEEDLRHARLVRRLAVISCGLHGHGEYALTGDERVWLAAQGVPVDLH